MHTFYVGQMVDIVKGPYRGYGMVVREDHGVYAVRTGFHLYDFAADDLTASDRQADLRIGDRVIVLEGLHHNRVGIVTAINDVPREIWVLFDGELKPTSVGWAVGILVPSTAGLLILGKDAYSLPSNRGAAAAIDVGDWVRVTTDKLLTRTERRGRVTVEIAVRADDVYEVTHVTTELPEPVAAIQLAGTVAKRIVKLVDLKRVERRFAFPVGALVRILTVNNVTWKDGRELNALERLAVAKTCRVIGMENRYTAIIEQAVGDRFVTPFDNLVRI